MGVSWLSDCIQATHTELAHNDGYGTMGKLVRFFPRDYRVDTRGRHWGASTR